jgi:hypothetical protein
VKSVSSPTPATAAVESSAEGTKQHNITGTIMSADKPGRYVADAKVEVVGADAARATQSDAAGNFVLASVTAGTVSLRVSKAGYQTWTKDGISLDGDKKIAVELFAEPPTDASGATATGRCNDGSWTWALIVAAACRDNGGLAYGVCPGPLCKSQ